MPTGFRPMPCHRHPDFATLAPSVPLAFPHSVEWHSGAGVRRFPHMVWKEKSMVMQAADRDYAAPV